MMRRLRNARRASRALACALVLMLGLSFATPSRAFLTELVVGGELAFSAVTLIGQALPQIMLVATNVLALVKSGQAIADTLKKIGSTIFGGGKDSASKPVPSVGSEPRTTATSDVPQIPTIPMSGDVKSSEIATAAVMNVPDSEMALAVVGVVDSYQRKMDLYNKLSGLGEGSLGRKQLAEPYSNLVDENEQAVNGLVTTLMDAIRDGKADTVDAFCAATKALDPASRPALIPVVNRVLEKGKTFAALNGEGKGLYPKLEALHVELTN